MFHNPEEVIMKRNLRGADHEFIGGLGSKCSWPTGSYVGSLVDRTFPVIPSYVDHGSHSIVRYQVDTCGFSPEDISIRTCGEKLIISGKSEERSPDHKVLREYSRIVDIPDGVDIQGMRSRLTSSGILSIEAPYCAPPTKSNLDRELPIEHQKPVAGDSCVRAGTPKKAEKKAEKTRSQSIEIKISSQTGDERKSSRRSASSDSATRKKNRSRSEKPSSKSSEKKRKSRSSSRLPDRSDRPRKSPKLNGDCGTAACKLPANSAARQKGDRSSKCAVKAMKKSKHAKASLKALRKVKKAKDHKGDGKHGLKVDVKDSKTGGTDKHVLTVRHTTPSPSR